MGMFQNTAGAATLSFLVAVSHVSAAEILPGNTQISGGLQSLQHKGRSIGNALKDKYTLVYFGTSYRLPNCSADLMVLQDVVKEVEKKCGSVVTPVFVYPDHPQKDNVKKYVDAPGSIILGLSGSQNDVFNIARQYKARYFQDESGYIKNHTRFTYLMKDGQNLAIIPADLPSPEIVKYVLKSLQDSSKPSLQCEMR